MFDLTLFEKCFNSERKYAPLLACSTVCLGTFSDTAGLRRYKGDSIMYVGPSSGFCGRNSRTKSKEMRIWKYFWRVLTPINAFGSVTGHPLPAPQLPIVWRAGCQDKQTGQSPGGPPWPLSLDASEQSVWSRR